MFSKILTRAFTIFFVSTIFALAADANLTLKEVTPQKVLFKNDGHEFYVIPTLVVAPNGDVLAIMERRIGNRADDGEINLVMKRSTDNGVTWSETSEIYGEGKNAINNPSPVVDNETGTIWLFFCRNNKEIWMTSSKDSGATWAPPQSMVETLKDPRQYEFFGTGPGHGIQLQNGPHKGRLLISSYAKYYGTADYKSGSKSYVIYSDDHGKTWKNGEPTVEGTPDGPDGNECMLAEQPDGSIYMTIRNNFAVNGNRAAARSTDGGITWSKIFIEADLPEPICEASVLDVPLPSGRMATIYTAPSIRAKERKDKSARRALSMWVSVDNTQTWKLLGQIYESQSAYSDMTLMRNGAVGVLFWVWTQAHTDEEVRFVSYKLTEEPTKRQ